jgi:hypothetical protein
LPFEPRWSAPASAPERIDEAIIGQVLQAGAGQAPRARRP